MKTKRLFLLACLPLFLSKLTSCQKSIGKVPLFHASYVTATLSDKERYLVNRYTAEDVNAALTAKASFFLFVYAQGCGTCDFFSPVLENYIKTTSAIIPYIPLSTYLQSNGPSVSDSSFLFFAGGKINDILTVSSLDNDGSRFRAMMDSHTKDTGSSILNNAYCETVLSVGYPSYVRDNTFLDAENPTTGYSFHPYSLTALTGTGKKVLYFNETSFSSLTALNTYYETETNVDLVFCAADYQALGKEAFASAIGLSSATLLGAATEVTYATPATTRIPFTA